MCCPERPRVPARRWRLPTSARRRATGFTLVDLMVGLVIGLLVSLSAAASMSFFHVMQRQQVGGAGALAQAVALRDIFEHELAQTGRGFFSAGTPSCTRLDAATPAGVLANQAAFLPARIARVDGRDTLEVLYGESVLAGAAVHLRTDTPADAPALSTQSWLPARAGDTLVLGNGAGATPCLLRTVASAEPDPVQGTRVSLAADSGFVTTGLAASSYPAGARVANAGTLVWRRFERNDANEVLMRDAVTGQAVSLAGSVVALRAQYGVADAPGEGVAQWVDAVGAWADPDTTLASRIRAVRIGIVVRSAQPEKPDAAGQCGATETAPVLWAGETVGLVDADWRCWRYRSAVSVVALRNFVTGTTP